jgi:hypothetical protein
MSLSAIDLVKEIVYEQSQVVGMDLALDRAEKTGFIHCANKNIASISVDAISKDVFSPLLDSYEELFGRASLEVCLNVLRRHPKQDIETIVPKNIVRSL